MSAPRTSLEAKVLSEHELRLVRGAYRVMAESGTQQLSLRTIARRLGVSPALLVYHFGSKDNLLIETMHWALAGTVRRVQARVAGIEEPRAALTAMLGAVFVGPRENRAFYLLYMDLVQYAVRRESFTTLAALLREHVDGTYATVIRQGAEAGAFDVDDVARAARQVRAVVEGGFLQWLQRDDWQEAHAVLQRDTHAATLRLLAPRAAA